KLYYTGAETREGRRTTPPVRRLRQEHRDIYLRRSSHRPAGLAGRSGTTIPEHHCQRFRSLELAEAGRPFVLAQQLRDSCRKWLLAGGSDAEAIFDKVVLEQFISRLPKRTAQWVKCHWPASLDLAIQLVEDQLVFRQAGVTPSGPGAFLLLFFLKTWRTSSSLI
uniref:SCAN box domain-containing protein n=1 Tax=Cyprinus carpio carpio TaxID=630221 RepID=A0A9J7XQJ9_CYPCA